MAQLLTHQPKDSGHVQHLAYDPDSKHLHVRFRNKSNKQAEPRTYIFAGVPSHVYEQMTKWPSAGEYFHRVIKRHYKLV